MNDTISSLPDTDLAVTVIIGRPNVGKSTLFNRLIGRRRAITHETPGVTRDPIQVRTRIEGIPCMLVDTGGFTLSKDELDSSVRERGLAYLKGADLILLLLDVRDITPDDEVFIERLRPYAEKVCVLANKADTPPLDLLAADMYRFGFSEVIPVSAVHGRNMDDLRQFIGKRLAHTAGKPAAETETDAEAEAAAAVLQPDAVTLAILGKPNTGKSTLVNALSGKELSIVSSVPGTTRDVIEGSFGFKGVRYTILDTAGIRRKSRVHENLEYYSVNRAIKTIEAADVVLLLIDAEENVTDQDKKISALIVRKGKGVIIVVNKWDLMEDLPNQRRAYEDRIRFMFPILDFAPIAFISALEGNGIPALLNKAYKVKTQLETEVQTSVLNKKLEEWVVRVPPPRSQKGQYKVRYLLQKSSKPVRFLLFVNKLKGFPKNYIQYIKNNIRKAFNLADIPIEIHVRE